MAEAIVIGLPGMAVMVALTFASGFFSGSETALFYLSQEQLESLRERSPRGRLAVDLLARPDRLLTAILFWNLVINLVYFTVGIMTARRLLDSDHEVLAGVLNVVAVVAIIVFGEVIPKSLAVVAGPQIATLASVPLAASARVLDPILPALATVAAAIRRVRYPSITPESMLEPKDLDKAAQLAESSPALTIDDARIFRNVLDMLDLTVEDLMWPRANFEPVGRALVDGVERSLLLAGDVIVELRPEADVDRIAAVHRLPMDQVIEAQQENRLASLNGSIFRELQYVPWSAPALAATVPLVDSECIGVGVVNEYGDVIGVVTAGDALEPIANPSASRARRLLEREPIVELVSGRFRVEGFTLLRVLAERIGIAEDEVENDAGDSRTVAGLIHDRLDRFATVGDEVVWMDMNLVVVRASQRGQIVIEFDPSERVATEGTQV